MVEGCLFCRIAAKEVSAKIVLEDRDVVAFEDIAPQAPVHLLVVPRRHVASVAELAVDDDALLGALFRVVNRLARERGIAATGFRVVANTGKDAQQSVPHLHWHLLGGRPLGWPPG